MTPLAEIFESKNYAQLRFRDHIACWSRVDFMIRVHPDGFASFLDGIKGQYRSTGGSLQGEEVIECVRKSFRESFGGDPEGFDEKWIAWVKTRPWRKRKKK